MMELNEIHLDSVDSTNNFAKQHLHEWDPKKITCITAKEQTAGRGRMQRVWRSPRGQNIYATFSFQLPIHALHLTSIAQVMALSLAMVLLKEGLQPHVKWPNDVQIEGKKMAGVLSETIFTKDHVDVIVGIGVNVNMPASEIDLIDQPATSLMLETHHEWDLASFFKKLQKQFLTDLQKFKKEGFTPFHSQFENLLAYKGQTIRCFDGKKEWVGICHSITNDGQLNLYLPNKEIHTLLTGDVNNTESKK